MLAQDHELVEWGVLSGTTFNVVCYQDGSMIRLVEGDGSFLDHARAAMALREQFKKEVYWLYNGNEMSTAGQKNVADLLIERAKFEGKRIPQARGKRYEECPPGAPFCYECTKNNCIGRKGIVSFLKQKVRNRNR